MNLEQAYTAAASTLMPQKQGTCGLYCFWYASVLLAKINNTTSIIYPRRGQRPTGSNAQTLRNWVKHTLRASPNSQGEILTVQEMEDMIHAFQYQCSSSQSATGGQNFITTSLASNRPVAIAYLHSNALPAGPVTTGTSADCGAHWGLIYKEDTTSYTYLNPHYPNTPQVAAKQALLASSAAVDTVPLDQHWAKLPGGGLSNNPQTVNSTRFSGGTVYDLGPPRQNLQNALVSIFI